MPKRGGSKGKKKPSLHDLTSAFATRKESERIFAEIEGANDRTAAILGATFVQSSLREALKSAIVNDDDDTIRHLMGRDGPLATFFSMIHLGYALNLMPRAIVPELEIVRRIRNVFAHSILPIDFQNPEIKKEVRKLRLAHPKRVKELAAISDTLYAGSDERRIYLVTCFYLASNLLAEMLKRTVANADAVRARLGLEPVSRDRFAVAYSFPPWTGLDIDK